MMKLMEVANSLMMNNFHKDDYSVLFSQFSAILHVDSGTRPANELRNQLQIEIIMFNLFLWLSRLFPIRFRQIKQNQHCQETKKIIGNALPLQVINNYRVDMRK